MDLCPEVQRVIDVQREGVEILVPRRKRVINVTSFAALVGWGVAEGRHVDTGMGTGTDIWTLPRHSKNAKTAWRFDPETKITRAL